MRTTVFELDTDGKNVRPRVTPEPRWQPFDEWEGEPLTSVHLVEHVQTPRATLQQVHIAAGGHFVMHTTPDLAHCQIVRGRGILRLPDDQRIPFDGPELYIFQPETLHEWTDIEEDTLLSVCLVHPIPAP
ncbi:hypothetical protein EF847_22300 [Actinobacteria bacterium YIM 96077]|uniref:Cupin domain-containing protein n=1 Tax=Phytoactinopolyspora halophila TaxID=1981511 RepID=A0A329QTA5_9ACTN|nr:hypothetical protein [Phytoactinopolyspora halophila]AYY15015.1 hypothetical protein EF847_22300 [Actinobacteria bacterium YIM 96077]RAW15473.1 hypothetical protein DPM12_09530 [Phytoactinopolyspora halophila]